MELLRGRPADCTGRLEKEIRTYDLLDRLGIPYDRVDHPAAANMDDCAEVDRFLGTTMCKNLFLCNRQKTDFYLLMIPADKPFKTKELSHQLGCSRLSFGDGEAMEELLDITPGSLSVMGLMNDPDNRVRLLVDQDLLRDEFLGCHPCINTSSLRLPMKSLTEIFLPAVHHTMTVVQLGIEA